MNFTKRIMELPSQDLGSAVALMRQAQPKGSASVIWGIWRGLFGMPSNEVAVITAHADREDEFHCPDDCVVNQTLCLEPTVRPTDAYPLAKTGLYVFRDFSLPREALDEAVRLSSEAWETFEQGATYAAQPVGLFTQIDPKPQTTLHLLTWYPDLVSWQHSRESDPQAMQRFLARRALTQSTVAVATQLML